MSDQAMPEIVEGLVLVIDDNPVRRAATLRYLVGVSGLSVLGARSYECHEVTLAARPDAIVLEPDSRGGIFPSVRDVLLEDARVPCLIFGDDRVQQARLTNPDVSHRLHARLPRFAGLDRQGEAPLEARKETSGDALAPRLTAPRAPRAGERRLHPPKVNPARVLVLDEDALRRASTTKALTSLSGIS